MRVWTLGLLVALGGWTLGGCGGDDDEPELVDPHLMVDDCEGEDIVSDDDCDQSLPPVVFVHGTVGSADNISNIAQLFGSNGYCQDRFVGIDYDSIILGLTNTDAIADQIDALVDEVRERTGADKVHLMGHSQGTGHCITYLSDPARAAKIDKYVNYSGTSAIPDGVHALSISSENDLGQSPNHPAGAEEMVTFEDEDHFTLAANTASFVETWKYLFGSAPERTEIACGDEMITLEGLAVTLADNTRSKKEAVEIYELGAEPWKRGEPAMTVTSDDDGHFGPIQLKRNVAYEFRNGELGAVYVAPMRRSNYLMRMITPSGNPLIAAVTTDQVELGPDHAALVFRSFNGAFRHDMGQTLKINGTEILTEENAGRTTNTVGLFAYDLGSDGESDLGVAFTAPFIYGTDFFVDATEPAWVEIEWNGQSIFIPNLPSGAREVDGEQQPGLWTMVFLP